MDGARRLRSGWRWRRSGARLAARAWFSVGTAGPSAEDFSQGRPSPGTWRSSAHPDPTSYPPDYRSSAGTFGDNESTSGWHRRALTQGRARVKRVQQGQNGDAGTASSGAANTPGFWPRQAVSPGGKGSLPGWVAALCWVDWHRGKQINDSEVRITLSFDLEG